MFCYLISCFDDLGGMNDGDDFLPLFVGGIVYLYTHFCICLPTPTFSFLVCLSDHVIFYFLDIAALLLLFLLIVLA